MFRPHVIGFAVAALSIPANAQQTVCGQTEYAASLRKSPPDARYLHYPIPPGARIDIQQTLNEGWPRRAFSETFVYRFPPGTRVSDVERFFVQAGVYKAFGTLYRDVNPNRRPGDSMRKVTEDDGADPHVTFSIFRRTVPSEGTPFGDVAWVAQQLRDHPPTPTDLTAPIYPGAGLDIDSSTARIVGDPSPVISYLTADSPESVKAFYGIPASEHSRKISPDNRLHRVSVAAFSSRDPQKRTKIEIQLPHEGPIAHLTGAGPVVPGAPPGWKPRQWKGGCVREPVAPIVVVQ